MSDETTDEVAPEESAAPKNSNPSNQIGVVLPAPPKKSGAIEKVVIVREAGDCIVTGIGPVKHGDEITINRSALNRLGMKGWKLKEG